MDKDSLASANLLERIGHLNRTEEKTGGLYPAQWAAMRYISQANRYSRTPIALARYLGATRGTTSQTLMALERKGYITRKPSSRDRRSIEIDLTGKGRTALRDDPILRLVGAIDSATGNDGKMLHAQLARILEHLIAANGGRAFGQCRTCRHFRRNGGTGNRQPHFCSLLEVNLSESDTGRICVEQE